ncbi:hypothetical protein [Halorussus lipolyticus]|uniref:hypothetical protein n=1 Tax=Halorussus lipolyticus TaxID=3034024 RepID=UPI0023E8D223|nr:hypothetical protein [Halorussus sp. DT80]
MNRRELLTAVGVRATGIVGFAGDRRATAKQDTQTTQTTTEDEGFSGIDSSAERPFATISVGSRAGVRNPENNQPHAVRVWNDSDSARTVALVLSRDGVGGETGAGGGTGSDGALVDRQVEFPADGYLTMRLLEPAGYALTVTPGGGAGGAETIRIPRAQFDCNDSATEVGVTPDGQVKSRTVTTEVGCPPEVTDRTFTAFAGSCGSASEASVSFADESVTVSGAIRTPNPCYGARLADVSVSSADTLRVVVATTEPSAGVCAQCVASVEYEAVLGVRDRLPETVEVVHRHDGQTETVATVTRGEETTAE